MQNQPTEKGNCVRCGMSPAEFKKKGILCNLNIDNGAHAFEEGCTCTKQPHKIGCAFYSVAPKESWSRDITNTELGQGMKKMLDELPEENWEEEFDEKFMASITSSPGNIDHARAVIFFEDELKIKSFIRKVAQSEYERGYAARIIDKEIPYPTDSLTSYHQGRNAGKLEVLEALKGEIGKIKEKYGFMPLGYSDDPYNKTLSDVLALIDKLR